MPYQVGKKQIFYVGEEGSGVLLRLSDTPQNFTEIKDKCLKSKELFEDPEFPPTIQTIGYIDEVANRNIKIEEVVWRRPKDIVGQGEKPLFYTENDIRDGGEFTRFDVNQGHIGDCWMLVCIANITLEPKLLQFIVPNDNTFAEENYCGAFHFRFWHKGVWLDVVIDDRLPCIYNSALKKYEVIFLKSLDNEFWPALLEKAYAKLMGSYKIIEAGLPNEAMEDFTGGIWELFLLETPNGKIDPNMFEELLAAHERGSFITAGTGPNDNLMNVSLVKSHAYSVTSVKKLQYKGKTVELLRLRNPYGGWMEWRGAWSDHAEEWNEIGAEEMNELQITFRSDGEFWIPFQDLKKHFSFLHVCHLSPEALDSEMTDPKWQKWNCKGIVGSFVQDKFAKESVQVVKVGHYHEEEHKGEPKGSLIVVLMNKNIPLSGKAPSPEYGFELYYIKDQSTPYPIPESFFTPANLIARIETKIGMREVGYRFHLAEGLYCIVPTCGLVGYDGEYLLRIVSEKEQMVESDLEYQKPWNCIVM